MAYEPKTWVKGETVTPLALNNVENAIAEANGDYVPHEWQCGEVVTADLLNHIEQGIANAGGGGVDPNVSTFTFDFGNSANFNSLHFKTVTARFAEGVTTSDFGGLFADVTTLERVVFPTTWADIKGGTCHGCTSLKEVYILCPNPTIDASAFADCTQNDLVINCAFAEGAVSGAPWGAENATINYNAPVPTDI